MTPIVQSLVEENLAKVYWSLLATENVLPQIRAIALAYPLVNLNDLANRYERLVRLQQTLQWCQHWEIVSIKIKPGNLTRGRDEDGLLTITGENWDLIRVMERIIRVAKFKTQLHGFQLIVLTDYWAVAMRKLIGINPEGSSIDVPDLPRVIVLAQERLAVALGNANPELFYMLIEDLKND